MNFDGPSTPSSTLPTTTEVEMSRRGLYKQARTDQQAATNTRFPDLAVQRPRVLVNPSTRYSACDLLRLAFQPKLEGEEKNARGLSGLQSFSLAGSCSKLVASSCPPCVFVLSVKTLKP
jgi:hypothetical protein